MKKILLIIGIVLTFLTGCSNNELKNEVTLETHGWKHMIRGAKKYVMWNKYTKTMVELYPNGEIKRIDKYTGNILNYTEFYHDFKNVDGMNAVDKIVKYTYKGNIYNQINNIYENKKLIKTMVYEDGKKKPTKIIKYRYPTITEDLVEKEYDNFNVKTYLDKNNENIKRIIKREINNLSSSILKEERFDENGELISSTNYSVDKKTKEKMEQMKIIRIVEGNMVRTELYYRNPNGNVINRIEVIKHKTVDGKIVSGENYFNDKLTRRIEVIY